MNILGTAREAYEVHAYYKLTKKYDKHTANKLIEPQLTEAGISVEKFEEYLDTKSKIQNGALSVSTAQKDAEDLAAEAIKI